MTDNPRIHPISVESAAPAAQELLARARKDMGMLPNVYRVMAHSPATLAGYDALAHSLDTGTLSKRVREQIALMCAATNACDYCLAAHRVTGRMANLSHDDIAAAERGEAQDRREAAALQLARGILDHVGDVDADTLDRARAEGLTDQEIIEIAGHVAANVFTNTINRLARTSIDFGRVARAAAEVSARFGRS
jgi:uncharacterized peroxidase-related enzyme